MSAHSETRAAELSTEPMRPAGPTTGFAAGTWQSLRDVAAKHELLGMLVRRELKSRYKDSVLGFLWTLIRPLALLTVYYVAIGKFLGAERSVPEFAIFIFAGLTIWQLFSDIVVGGTGSIVNNGALIKKVYLPREIFPLASIGSALFNFGVQLVILVGATVVLGRFQTTANWWYFPLALIEILIWGSALALLLGALNVYLRDVQYIVEIILMFLFWGSPVIYLWSFATDALGNGTVASLYLSNPMTAAVLGFQQAFWVAGNDQPAPPHLAERLMILSAIGLVVLWLCQRVFARLQANFAQEL